MILIDPAVACGRLYERIQPTYERFIVGVAVFSMLCGSNLFNKKTLLFSLLVFAPFVCRHGREILSVVVRPSYISLLALYFGLSYLWSVMPDVSFPYIWTQLVFVVLAFIIAASGKVERVQYSIYWASIAHLTLVVLYCILDPVGAWSPSGLRAFYPQKNVLAVSVAVDAMAIAFIGPRVRLNWLAFLAALAVLFATQSKTSISLLLIVFLLLPAFNMLSRCLQRSSAGPRITSGFALRSVLWGLLVMSVLSIPFFSREITGFIVSNLSKEALTGRGTLWLLVFNNLGDRSIYGLGPGVFWQAGGKSEAAQTSAYQLDPMWLQNMISADGSYVDLIASIGFIGLALYMLVIGDCYRKILHLSAGADRSFIFVSVSFFVMHSVTESTIFYSTNIGWFILLLCVHTVNLSFHVQGQPNLLQRLWRVN